MARVQPVLTPTELVLVDQGGRVNRSSKRTEVIRAQWQGLHHWFVKQAVTGSQIVARRPTGEEVAIETAELAVLEGKGKRLSPEELGLLAKQLA